MLHINFYDHRVCRKNIIYNWKQLSFKFLCKWWVSDFCKLWNRSQMDFSQWCSICSNFTRTCFNLWQGYLCLICNGRESGRERDREKEREREREREREFFEILSLFCYEMFSWVKIFIPDEKISLPKSLPNKQFFWRYVKTFINDFPFILGIVFAKRRKRQISRR